MMLRFEVRFDSDYHVGAGYGKGQSVDSALQRDSDGWPVIRGTTIVGLLRDSLLKLLSGTPELSSEYQYHLDQINKAKHASTSITSAYCKNRLCPLCRILGTPAVPKPWKFSSARPVDAPNPQISIDGIPRGLPVTRIKVQPENGRALDGHLFIQEEGSRMLVFQFDAECHYKYEEMERDAALIVAAARMVRSLGSARRRGRGRCLWSVLCEDKSNEIDVTGQYLANFKSWWIDKKPYPLVGVQSYIAKSSIDSDEKPVTLRMIARSDEPLLISEKPATGNMFHSLDHINGTTLWGALAVKVAQRLGLNESSTPLESHDIFAELFFGGGFRVSPLYPAAGSIGTGKLRMQFPAPLDLLRCNHKRPKKISGLESSDEAQHTAVGAAVLRESPDYCLQCEGSMSADQGFYDIRLARGLELGVVKMQEEMHPRIDFDSQQVNQGDLFGYNALAPGQYFIGELNFKNQSMMDLFLEVSGLSTGGVADQTDDGQAELVRVGKATSRGYGALSFTLSLLASGGESVESDIPFCAGFPLESRIEDISNADESYTFTLSLMSDTILLDEWGRFYGSMEDRGLVNSIFSGLSLEIVPINAFCRVRNVDGFSRHLGLPRWRDKAIVAGSTVGLKAKPLENNSNWKDQLIKRLKELENSGIGLRLNEGFGRVVFNHPVYRNESSNQTLTLPNVLRPKAPSGSYAMRQRLLDRVEDKLKIEFSKTGKRMLFKDEEIRPLAQWLHTQSDRSCSELFGEDYNSGMLSSFGRGNALHHVNYDKDNWYEEKGRSAINAIREIVKNVREDLIEFERKKPKSIESVEPELIKLLAGEIASCVSEKRKNSG